MSRTAQFLLGLVLSMVLAGCGSEGTEPENRTGPIVPIPSNLWQPPSGLPASGSYVYLDSDPGDYIGQGTTNTYTTNITATITDATMGVTVAGYGGIFQAMSSITTLKVGYYPDLTRVPFNDPAVGGLSWEGNGRGCNMLTGWFVVDQITLSGSQLATADVRFEQHCEGGTPALHGAIHWVG